MVIVQYTSGIGTPAPRETAHPYAVMAAKKRAMTLTCMVRDESADTIGAYLDQLDRDALYALTVTLAAMVPDDVPMSVLLAWIDRHEVAA